MKPAGTIKLFFHEHTRWNLEIVNLNQEKCGYIPSKFNFSLDLSLFISLQLWLGFCHCVLKKCACCHGNYICFCLCNNMWVFLCWNVLCYLHGIVITFSWLIVLDLSCPIKQWFYLSQTGLSAMDPEEKVRICKTKAHNVWTSKTCPDACVWPPSWWRWNTKCSCDWEVFLYTYLIF